MPSYKLPRCWLGQEVETAEGKRLITADEVNAACHCANALHAHLCMEGHLTECHAGMTCDEAKCAHYKAEREAEGDVELVETDLP